VDSAQSEHPVPNYACWNATSICASRIFSSCSLSPCQNPFIFRWTNKWPLCHRSTRAGKSLHNGTVVTRRGPQTVTRQIPSDSSRPTGGSYRDKPGISSSSCMASKHKQRSELRGAVKLRTLGRQRTYRSRYLRHVGCQQRKAMEHELVARNELEHHD
jgi:hypothetical protein